MVSDNNTLKVLIVDDDFKESDSMFKLYCDIGNMVASTHGKKFVYFKGTDGQEGIDLFREHHPDIVISDYEMPGKDGLEFLAEVSPEMNSTVFNFTTSCHDYGIPGKVQKLGGIFHQKPLGFSEIKQIYEDFLSQDNQ